jgi:hypothetical protein
MNQSDANRRSVNKFTLARMRLILKRAKREVTLGRMPGAQPFNMTQDQRNLTEELQSL